MSYHYPEENLLPDEQFNIWKHATTVNPRRDSGLLVSVVGQIVKRRVRPATVQKETIDARELQKMFRSKEPHSKLRQGWIYAVESYDSDLRNPETVTAVNTQELLASARSAAEKQRKKVCFMKYKPRVQSPWTSALETEQKLVRQHLAFDRYRSQFLKKKLDRMKGSGQRQTASEMSPREESGSESESSDSEESARRSATPKVPLRRTDTMTREEIRDLMRRRHLKKKQSSSIPVDGEELLLSPGVPKLGGHASSFDLNCGENIVPPTHRKRREALVTFLGTCIEDDEEETL